MLTPAAPDAKPPSPIRAFRRDQTRLGMAQRSTGTKPRSMVLLPARAAQQANTTWALETPGAVVRSPGGWLLKVHANRGRQVQTSRNGPQGPKSVSSLSLPQIPSAARRARGEVPKPGWEGTDGIDACKGPTGKIPPPPRCLVPRVVGGHVPRLAEELLLRYRSRIRVPPNHSTRAEYSSCPLFSPPAISHPKTIQTSFSPRLILPHKEIETDHTTQAISPRRSASRCRGCGLSGAVDCALPWAGLAGARKREAVCTLIASSVCFHLHFCDNNTSQHELIRYESKGDKRKEILGIRFLVIGYRLGTGPPIPRPVWAPVPVSRARFNCWHIILCST